MFRSFVVPLDGSELAERALPYATQLAHAANGHVMLVRVATASPRALLHGFDWAPQMRAVRDAETYVNSVAEKVATRVPVATSVASGRPPLQIVGLVESSGVDAVVMTTHARTGPPHLLHGSVAEALLQASPVPVLLVPARPGAEPAYPFNPTTACAAVPLDGSAFAESALHVAANLVGPRGALVLVCIVQPPHDVQRDQSGRVIAYLDQQEEAQARGARGYLQRLAVDLGRRYPGLRITHHVRCGEAAPGIIAAASDTVADVVVMSTHGRTGVSRVLLGSVAGEVVANGHTPVCLVGPHVSDRTGGDGLPVRGRNPDFPAFEHNPVLSPSVNLTVARGNLVANVLGTH